MNRENINSVINFVTLIWALLVGYFTFSDLTISISVVNFHSGWAIFLQNFGEVPGLLLLYSGAIIFLASFKSANIIKLYSILLFVFLGAVYLLRHLSVVLYYGISGNYDFINKYRILSYILFSLLNILIYQGLKRVKFSERVKSFSSITVLLGIFSYLLSIQPIKHLWGRVRFRDLEPLYTNFTYWFMPNGLNGNDSFPSGHAALAWMILPLIVLTDNKILKWFLLILIIVWGTIVSLSRIVIGAHFASDVLFGSAIVITCFLFLLKKLSENIIQPEIKK